MMRQQTSSYKNDKMSVPSSATHIGHFHAQLVVGGNEWKSKAAEQVRRQLERERCLLVVVKWEVLHHSAIDTVS